MGTEKIETSKKLNIGKVEKSKKKLSLEKVKKVKDSAPLKEEQKNISNQEIEVTQKEDKGSKFSEQMGRGQPKKDEHEKAKNKTLLYWNNQEISEIEKVAEINGFSKKDKNKYLKSIIKKIVRAELRQFG